MCIYGRNANHLHILKIRDRETQKNKISRCKWKESVNEMVWPELMMIYWLIYNHLKINCKCLCVCVLHQPNVLIFAIVAHWESKFFPYRWFKRSRRILRLLWVLSTRQVICDRLSQSAGAIRAHSLRCPEITWACVILVSHYSNQSTYLSFRHFDTVYSPYDCLHRTVTSVQWQFCTNTQTVPPLVPTLLALLQKNKYRRNFRMFGRTLAP